MTARRLRLASADDRPGLLDLWQEAWSAAMPSIDFVARRPWMDARLAEFERDGTLVVLAEHDSLAAGFITVDVAARYVDQMAVRPSLQGRGWAGLLLGEAKRLSPAGLELRVNQANHRAIRLYRRAGFAIVAADTNASSGQPVWLMRWVGARADAG